MGDKGGDRKREQRKARAKPPSNASSDSTRSRPVKRRPRHRDGDYEKLLCEAEGKNWTIEKGGRYFKAKCGCPEKKWVSVHLTPSSSRTLINTRKQFERCPCWHDEDARTEDTT